MPRFASRKGRLALVLGLAAALALAIVSSAVAGDSQNNSPGQYLKQVFIEKLAGVLGIDQARLEKAIMDAGKQTADEALAQGKLTEKQAATLKERLEKGDAWFPGQMGPRGQWKGHLQGRPGSFFPMAFSPVNLAEALGLTQDELKSALQEGQTLADIAAAKGLTLDQLKETLLSKVKESLDQAVSSGKITQQQADQILEKTGNMDLNRALPGPKPGSPKAGFNRFN